MGQGWRRVSPLSPAIRRQPFPQPPLRCPPASRITAAISGPALKLERFGADVQRIEPFPDINATVITAPRQGMTRGQAQSMLKGVLHDLSRTDVIADCADMAQCAPSFVDELVKAVLVDRQARVLRLENPSDEAREHAERSAANRRVRDRLEIVSWVRPQRGWSWLREHVPGRRGRI